MEVFIMDKTYERYSGPVILPAKGMEIILNTPPIDVAQMERDARLIEKEWFEEEKRLASKKHDRV